MKEYEMHNAILATPDLLRECLQEPLHQQIRLVSKMINDRKPNRIFFTGCGTSYMIAQAGAQFFRELLQEQAIAETAFELFPYEAYDLQQMDMLIAYSHTGGTKAVIDLVKQCQAKGIFTIGISEVAGSRLSEACDCCLIGPGGKDQATPKTRSFSTGCMISLLLAAGVAELRQTAVDWTQIRQIPDAVELTLQEVEASVISLVTRWKAKTCYMLVGSGSNRIAAQEGSLKLLETTTKLALYTSIEELAHGNELYLDDRFGIFLCYPEDCRGKLRLEQMIEGCQSTTAQVCILTNDASYRNERAQVITYSTKLKELYSMFLMILPIQLYAYHLSIQLGMDPDQSTAVDDHMKEAIRKFHPPGYH